MRPGTILYLYRVRLRARLVQELLAVAGIAVGVALLFASQVANSSLSGAVSQLTNGLVGNARLQIAARSPSGFSEGLLNEIEAMPGVSAAAPVLQRNISIVGRGGHASVALIGLNPRFLALNKNIFVHVDTTEVSAQRGIALPAPIAHAIGVGPLQPVVAQVGDRSVRTHVSLVLQQSDVGALIDSQIAISPLGYAQQLTSMPGRISRILVEPRHGYSRVVTHELARVAGGRLNVVPADFEATVFHQAEGPTAQSTQMFSAISALVGFLFAFNAMLLTVPQRRNLISDLRLDGYPPFEIVEVMLFDVLVLGAVGVLLGFGLGELLSHSILQAEPGYLSLAFPVGSKSVVSWQSIAIASVGGLTAAVVGVMFPLRRDILGRDAALRSRRRHPSTGAIVFGCGLACLAFTTVILFLGIDRITIAILAFVSLTLALLLILPAAFSLVAALIDRAQRPLLGVAPRIALIELMSSATRPRSLAIAATGAIAVFGSVSIEGARSNLSVGLGRAAADLSQGADLWVTPPGSATTLPTTPFVDSYGRRLRALPGVARVNSLRGGFLDLGDRRVLVLGPPTDSSQLLPRNQLRTGSYPVARMRLSGGPWVAISQNVANEWKLHVGDRLMLSSPSPTPLRIAAMTTNLGWSPGTLLMSSTQFARAWASNQISAYQIELRPTTTLARGIREVRSALRSSALVVQSADQHERNDIAAQRQGLARLTQIAILVLVAAALAMAAAMAAMIWQRRGRLASMKVDGYATSELWYALLCEAALLLGTACLIGALFGLYGQLVLGRALVAVTGFPVVFSVAATIAVVSLAAVTAIALVVVALPGYLASQVKPALRD